MATAVKRIHESMRGAPVLTGLAGSLVALLDTFLVNGWGLATALSATVASGVCTINMSAGDNFEEGCVVLVAGATPAVLNGEHRLTAGGSTLKFATAAANGPATGTITVKYAPAGWEKAFTGANQAVYRSKNVMGPRRYLRVVDTTTLWARVTGYNAMTSVSAGTNLFPTAAQQSGGLYWHKSSTADSAGQRYDMLGDDRFFYYAPAPQYAGGGGLEVYAASQPWFYGDPIALRTAGDAWTTVIGGSDSSYWASTAGCIGVGMTSGIFTERIPAGTGASTPTYAVPEAGSVGAISGEDSNGAGPWPGAIDGKLRLCRIHLNVSVSDWTRRAGVPGVYSVPHSGLTAYAGFLARDTVPGPGALADRKFLLLWVGNGSKQGGIFIDADGDWR